MSSCDAFNIPFSTPVAEYVEKAKKAIAKMNGVFAGDETQGSFEVNSPMGKVTGSYIISNQTIIVTITDKPMMLGCGMIEGLLKGALA